MIPSRSLLTLFMAPLMMMQSSAQTGWTTLNIPDAGRYDDIFFVNADTGWAAGGPSGWIRRTNNGGATWSLQLSSPYYLRSIEFVDENVGYCGALSGQLYRTANGGQNWTDISGTMSPAPIAFCGLSAPDANTVYGCGVWSQPAFIYKSSDAGATWTYMDMSAHASRLVDIHFLSADTGFATGTANPPSNGGVILRTTDGGATWTTVCTTNALTDIVWKIQWLDDQHCYASIYSEPTNDDTRMLRSFDGGLTWEQITISDTYTYVETIGFIDPLHGWTGGEGTLWETNDGGTTWQTIPLGYAYNRFFRINDSTAYLSGAQVYKYHRDLSTGISASAPRRTFHALSVAPNPNTGSFVVHLRLDRPTIADLRVVAPDGRTALQLIRERNAPAGEQNIPVDLDAVPSSYFVVLKTSEGMLWEKLVLR